jgi:hypothetical protein
MFARGVVACVFLLVVSGCAQEQKPKITYSPPVVEPKPVTSWSKPIVTRPNQKKEVENVPRDWLPAAGVEKDWTAVVVHHSATDSGNASIFDEWHREEKNWNGVGYDFVIGNGAGSTDGEVEVTYRWKEQTTGAHCGGTPDNWANKDGIGICLVGNFNNEEPTTRQMQSMARLVRFLQRRYDISIDRIYGHNSTPGARVTDCPGRRFPMARFKSMLGG